jgi:hypothetical protein
MKRTNKITFRLSDKELSRFKKRVKESGLFQETYLRLLIEGFCPNQLPPSEFWKETGDLFHILNDLDKLEKIAYHTGNIHFEEIKEMYQDISDRLHLIEDEIFTHVPIDLRSIPKRERPKQKYAKPKETVQEK